MLFDNIFNSIQNMNDKLLYGEDVNLEDVESYIGMVALLYVTANIDNQIDRSEEEIINLYKYNITRSLDRPNRENLRDMFYNYAQKIDKIEANKETIKISEALSYFPEYELSQKTKDTLESLVSEIIMVDGVMSKEEEKLKDCINIFLEKGYTAIKEIAKRECR